MWRLKQLFAIYYKRSLMASVAIIGGTNVWQKKKGYLLEKWPTVGYQWSSTKLLRNVYLSGPIYSDQWFKAFVTIKPYYDNENTTLDNTLGSGFIVDKSGLVLTGLKTLKSFNTVSIELNDTTKLTGRVVYTKSSLNLALIKLESANNLSVVDFDLTQNNIKVGTPMISIGNPRIGMKNAITEGVVSFPKRKGRQVVESDATVEVDKDYIQHTAPVKTQDYGSAIVDAEGRVIGMNAYQHTLQINSAVRAPDLKDFVDEYLKVSRNNSTLSHTGLVLHWIDSSSKKDFHLPNLPEDMSNNNRENGLIVSAISAEQQFNQTLMYQNSVHNSYEKLQVNDLIIKINGIAINCVEDLYFIMNSDCNQYLVSFIRRGVQENGRNLVKHTVVHKLFNNTCSV
ncbi:serine protease HTRA1A-like [Oppia nitens]|uniref:serine protease HTRA1A-like n=1 Tax=Oppia nitens TaxID=1686743 RepID=UPI0023DC3B7D|nr:serine protease HTRA1A-like [Oppia nitens]